MTKQEIINKMDALGDDQEFAARIEAAGSPEELQALLAEKDIHVTEEELKGLAQQAGAPDNLDEDALDQVSGGRLYGPLATGPFVRPSAALAAWFARRFW